MVGPDEAARMLRVMTARPTTVEVDELHDGWRVTVRVDGRLEARRRFAGEVEALVWAAGQEHEDGGCE